MEYFVGALLALALAVLAAGIGFGRDRSFAPIVLIVIASYYVLFAVIGRSQRTVVTESLIAIGFLFTALIGFKRNLWLVAVAFAGHGLFDFVHGFFIHKPGVPSWWPGFCLAFDVLFGVWVVLLLVRRANPSLSGRLPPNRQF